MPSHNNQRQRSKAGVKLLKSKKSVEISETCRLDEQLAKAADIESQLGALANKKVPSDDDKSYKLRSHLCEVLSDVLISNPKMSLEKDCFQRLWRGCFYNPIRIWRQQVSREKRKRSPSLPATQEGFKHFLSEAVTLYDYLVLQYLTKLVPSSTQQEMTQQSADTLSIIQERTQLEDSQYASQSTVNDSLSSERVSTDSMDGVVRGLYKLYIFLGDLHRYAEAYNKAETNYLNASKLGPGLGNPYNQLAVVAFSKDAYCVALYWYARSMLATHEKFSTSSNNLERLFQSNREFLVEHGRNSAPTVFQKSTGGSKNKNKSSAMNSMVRAQKAAAMKSCLTYFVDLHYDLYQQLENHKGGQNGSNESVDDDVEAKRLREKLKNVVASFESLLQASGFSDALLCKIVVINSFSLERASSNPTANALESPLSKSLAIEYFFSLGVVLAEQVEKLLKKSIEKAPSNKSVPSVRCLLPFEMLLDFVGIRLNTHNSCDSNTDSVQVQFWKHVAVVGNLVRNFLKCYKINPSVPEESASANTSVGSRHTSYSTKIKEYQLLKGYRPFHIVNENYLSNKDGFVDAAEAINVLELSTSQIASQDTSAVSAISESDSTMNGNTAKLLRMIELCELLASPTSIAPLVSKSGNYMYWTEGLNKEDSHERRALAEDSEDDAMDVVVYHETQEVSKNIIPVSSDLANASHTIASAESKGKKLPESTEARNIDVTIAVTEEHSPPSTSLVKPPPGFEISTTIPPTSVEAKPATTRSEQFMNQLLTTISDPTLNPSGFASPPNNTSILNQVIQGSVPSKNLSSSLFQLPQQQDHSIIPVAGLSSISTQNIGTNPLRSNLPFDVNESIRVFGDMKTANPFVVDPPPSAFSVPTNDGIINEHQKNDQNTSIISNYVTEDNFTKDDTKWLNSNLLNSLWMSESSQPNNPWAGN